MGKIRNLVTKISRHKSVTKVSQTCHSINKSVIVCHKSVTENEIKMTQNCYCLSQKCHSMSQKCHRKRNQNDSKLSLFVPKVSQKTKSKSLKIVTVCHKSVTK